LQPPGNLRQQHRNAIAALDAIGLQCVGEPVGRLAQPTIGDLLVTPVGPRMQNGKAAGLLLGPAITDIDADIVTGGHRPAELAD
jgi:hypothetical protein